MNGDEAQGTMGRRKARFLPPAFLCAQMFIERERETSGYEAAFRYIFIKPNRPHTNIDIYIYIHLSLICTTSKFVYRDFIRYHDGDDKENIKKAIG